MSKAIDFGILGVLVVSITGASVSLDLFPGIIKNRIIEGTDATDGTGANGKNLETSERVNSTPASRVSPAMAANRERSFIMIKPDGVQRGLVGDIIKRFEQKGFKLVAIKLKNANEDLLKRHYADLSERPFFPDLIEYMQLGPVVPMVWEGLNVVKTGRQLLGETNPADSKPGTIRGDFCIQTGRNIIHGSDSVESANKEIALWFDPKELVSWTPNQESWVYEDPNQPSVKKEL